MKFDKLTEEQLSLLKDCSLTANELSKCLSIGIATVGRWRKCLGIVIGRGSKKGKARPWQIKQDIRICPECNSSFSTTPARKKVYCSLKCSTKNIDKGYMQTEAYSESLSKEETPEYKKYSGRVHRLSRKIYEANKHMINPENHPRGLAGQDGVYHLDHIISIRYGFDNNISAEEIAKLDNLQMLPWRENISKGK